MPVQLSEKVLSWAPDADGTLIEQVSRLASLPFIQKVALMPDAHVGVGSSIGTVFASKKVIIPAAVGVDIGCGMLARRYPHKVQRLGDLDILRDEIMQKVPTGMGKAHTEADRDLVGMPQLIDAFTRFTSNETTRLLGQFGTLGGGNHFIEVCKDEDDNLWVVIHSGSRGIGNILAARHMEVARAVTSVYMLDLAFEAVAKDKNLAYLVEGTAEFSAYLADMLWAQKYAWGNRLAMLRRVEEVLRHAMGIEWLSELSDGSFTVHCHHNYASREHVLGANYWVTRKGAISARLGEYGVVPGSMATGSFITVGQGSEAGLMSSSHGAGRVMSRKKAREAFDADSLRKAMHGVQAWNDDFAGDIVDEHPGAYKPLGDVMAAQTDLTSVKWRLRPLVNVKGKN